MAISSGLAAMALVGFSTLRAQAEFSDSVDRLKETVLAKRTEALTTVKSGGGTDANNVTIGKLLTFTRNSSVVQVQTLQTVNNFMPGNITSPAANQAVRVSAAAGDTSTFTMAWGLMFQDAQLTGPPLGSSWSGVTQVAFVRSATDGSLQTAVSRNGGFATLSAGVYRYDDFLPNGAAVNLNFIDPTNKKAFLTIDPTRNGVTRKFQ